MGELSDYELIKRFCKGHAEAFEELVERHRQLTYNFIYRMVRNRENADDLFQETWLKVLKAAHTYRPRAKFTTWALQIARNATLDFFKRSNLRRHASLDATPSGQSEESSFAATISDQDQRSAIEGLIASEHIELLGKAVERLPQNQREALIMRIYHELPYSDISELLDTPEGTAKYWVHEAIKALTDHLQRINVES